MVNELIKIFENRRSNLVKLLDNARDDMDAGKQHQLYGAILEIDNVLEAMQDLHCKNISKKLCDRKDNLLRLKC
ncbi:MAG: hypothetical protein V1859_01655 [archaeon]